MKPYLPLVSIVTPSFNQARYLEATIQSVLSQDYPRLEYIVLDDGSRDGTLAVLRGLAGQRPGQIETLALPTNQGKAEAVRQGMRHALTGPSEIVGYVDADLATPPVELQRLAWLAREGSYDVLMGSRVQLLGRSIERNNTRHYVGRVFATCASLSLGLPVYDTQCGAKLFRRTDALAAALATPFTSRWAFDVELLARLVRPQRGIAPIDISRIREEPLLTWTDIPGSKLRPWAALRGGFDLLRLAVKTRRGS